MSEQLVVSEVALSHLNATRPWVKFLSILGFIGVALMALFSVALIFGIWAFPTRPGMQQPSGAFGMGLGILYLLFALIYLIPCLFLYRYGAAISAIPTAGQGALEDALKNQKSFWKFMGIVALVIVGFEVLLLAIILLIALAAHH
ncbi:MAG TPA: hypothetical protein VGM16_10955 [Gammaproteobacteria bacterium]|jgi:hypothetical protein